MAIELPPVPDPNAFPQPTDVQLTWDPEDGMVLRYRFCGHLVWIYLDVPRRDRPGFLRRLWRRLV